MAQVDNELYDKFVKLSKEALKNNTPIEGEYCYRGHSGGGTHLSMRMSIDGYFYSTEGYGDVLLYKGVKLRQTNIFKWWYAKWYVSKLALLANYQKRTKKENDRIAKLMN